MRPLLVEGMIGRRKKSDYAWTVFIDSEIYPPEVFTDGSHRSFKRSRNTIAHELVHILSFRLDEYGANLIKPKAAKQSQKDFIKSIESQTEKLSPLLLLPTKALARLVQCKEIADFSHFCDEYGVSRYVFIQRLNLLRTTGEEITVDHFPNLAIGLCNKDRFKSWPLFYNFDNNIVPYFLHDLTAKKPIKISTVFPGHPNETDQSATRMEVFAGTYRTQKAERLKVELFTEDTNNPDKLFLLGVPKVEEDSSGTTFF